MSNGERESDDINSYKGRRAKGQVFDNLRENEFEELYDVIVWFPELGVRNQCSIFQYAQEIAIFSRPTRGNRGFQFFPYIRIAPY